MFTPSTQSLADGAGDDDSTIPPSMHLSDYCASMCSMNSLDSDPQAREDTESFLTHEEHSLLPHARELALGDPMLYHLQVTEASTLSVDVLETLGDPAVNDGQKSIQSEDIGSLSSSSTESDPPSPHNVPIDIVSEPRPGSLPSINLDERPRSNELQPQQLTGWAAVEKTLNDYDKQEIGGYKEDIDSLLTFTGLYSAVLTAFVIVSFTQLQEDTAAESLKVLRLIANQTAGGVAPNAQPAGSTAAFALFHSPPFQPTTTAIRVNVLWFASLVISLSTASFAILVKQWLREYMAFSSTSPQGQVRIRHLRRSGLNDWHVLGIASMLPFLLQISLALFFVGLCFFTSDIHPAIGYTTIPLVGAWAFLFIAVTLAPIFSVRCPLKTPALVPVITALRTRIYAPFITSWAHPARLAAISLGCLSVACALLLIPPVYLMDKLAGAAGVEDWEWPYALFNFIDKILDSLQSTSDRFTSKTRCWDEKEVSRDGSKDLIILASADTIQDNPELNSTTFEAALDQIAPHWSEAIELLVKIIGNRIPLPAFVEGPGEGLIDLKSLPVKTQDVIKRLFVRHVETELSLTQESDDIDQSWHSWKAGTWAISVFFSVYGYGPWELDPPCDAFWAYIRRWLAMRCQEKADNNTSDPQLLLWTCSYIARTEVLYTAEEDLDRDTSILDHAITVSVKRSEELGYSQRIRTNQTLGPLAARAARRLVESASKFPSRCYRDWEYTVELIVLKLCGVVQIADYWIDCEALLGRQFRDLVSLRTTTHDFERGHVEMVTVCMSLPSKYVSVFVYDGLMHGEKYQEHDYISIGEAISAVAKDAIVQNFTVTQILNLSLIALSMERAHAGQWLGKQFRSSPEGLSNRPHTFNFLASALANTRNVHKENDVCVEREVVEKCWWRVTCMFKSSGHELQDELEDLDLTNLPYLSYFLLELSLFIIDATQGGPTSDEQILFEKIHSKSTEEKNGIRERGERYIGRSASSQEKPAMADRGFLRSIQDVIRPPTRRRSNGAAYSVVPFSAGE